jgi:hypothetical protein
MNTSNNRAARATRIDALANDIIADAKAREVERRRLADEGMEKIRRHFASGSKSEVRSTWNR